MFVPRGLLVWAVVQPAVVTCSTASRSVASARAVPVTARQLAASTPLLPAVVSVHAATMAEVGSMTAAHSAVSAATGICAVSVQLPAAVVK